ncbi:MAG: hypothetical protein SFY67_11305 [Candidatus Melainabacteria bacterium]|nr:hypothetical protein [Candidatus Melainabacteria bacterium]
MSAKSQSNPNSISPARAALIESATRMAEEVLAKQKMCLVELKLENSGQTKVIELTIYKPSGRVSLDDCELISRELDVMLTSDSEFGSSEFLLQVQSPGIDRKLKSKREFDTFKGELVEVKYKDNLDVFGYHLLGTLGVCDEENVVIESPKEFPSQDKKSKSKSKSKSAESKSANSMSESKPKNLKLKLARVSELKLYPQILISSESDEQLNNTTTE